MLIYRILINILILFSPLIILIRLIKKKEHPIRFKEKFCFFSKKRGNGKLVWFHGASVGEILSVIPLIEKLEKNKKIKKILITSSTLSSSQIILKYNFKKTIHQFFPIDSNYFVNKFLSYWKPSLVIFIESEIWPNMIMSLKKRKISHILLNGRITRKSYRKWKMISLISKKLFESFNICYPQSKESLKHLRSLGAKKFKLLGNLKFCENEKKIVNKNSKIKNFLKKKHFWCASSTHNSEEIVVANTHKHLSKKYKKLTTIIIPRHVHRVNDISQSIKKLGLNVHIHSSLKKINNNTDIYIVDTFGETKSFFKLCNTVFLGGSLIDHGGQNPLEAARFGCKIIHGPNIHNFTEIYELLKKNKIKTKKKNINQMSACVDTLIRKKRKSLASINKIKKLGSLILSYTLSEINFFIKKNDI